MIAQLDSPQISIPAFRLDTAHAEQVFLVDLNESKRIPVAMVPPELLTPMRRQPTPELIAPLRWSIWSMIGQVFSALRHRVRFSPGFERD